MLITRRSDYALRICRALQDGGRHNVSEICRLEGVPRAFTYKILGEMEQRGIVRAERGNRGGYSLKMSLDDITLYDIVSHMEEDIAMMHCMREDCDRNAADNPCMVHREIARIQGVLIRELKRKTVGQILTGQVPENTQDDV